MYAAVLVLLASGLSPGDASAPPYGSPEKAEILDPSAAGGRTIHLRDVVNWTVAGLTDEAIVAAVHRSRTIFRPTGDDIVWLKQNGVHDCVIEAMQATASRPLPPPGVVYVNEPPPPVVIYREPPPVIGVGFGYHRGW